MDRVDAGTDMSFRIGFTGYSGHLRLEPLPPVERSDPLKSLPDFILPSAFQEETPESLKKYLEDKYLLPELDLEEFSVEKDGRQWDFDWFDKAKVHLEPTLPRTVIVPEYELPFKRPKDWEPKSVEINVSELMEGSHESGSTPRMPGPAKDFVRGSIGNRPFRPGGLDASQSSQRVVPEGARTGEWVREILDGGSAQVVPPGFKHGLDLGDLMGHPCSWKVYKDQTATKSSSSDKLSSLSVQFDDLFKRAWEDDITEESQHGDGSQASCLDGSKRESLEPESEKEEGASLSSSAPDSELAKEAELSRSVPGTESLVLDEILSTNTVVSRSDEAIASNGEQKEASITKGSQSISDRFSELVPDMALDFPFELDTFQKEAIFYLEKGESVFVAAHTSAGKTVVAEYAFALASKHCTRAVYTAPIKTISNQKYRDFCGKFDVGLLTGDVSIRPEASCLIMTTEILRSMLYRGADIIRDIEWVIFDEVHYVNDVERGVVWEEVIIMLPRHVNIVLLSATVPNTKEFADWIGRTKQKEIRVTGTNKRPVPLEHCLFYSGELYKICENEIFQPQGLKTAKDAHKKKNSIVTGNGTGKISASTAPHGGAPVRQQRENPSRDKQQKHFGNQTVGSFPSVGGPNQNTWGSRKSEASLWMQLINKLSKKSFLPVIIFCFSKNRCDKSADNMTTIDLTSSSEKSEIRVFCDKAFSRLKGSDRNLPQVVRVQSLLRRGIGVHHAGLLPIVKEVVEMLFCRGVIKVLFSTETFAMGVNAPARTVVFDALRKFDGKEFRQLLPGEYTQMAGRAGRRGLDKIGTVVVMCRDEIPEERELKHVIVGSATRLESQFRLTYIMILHLLRVEELKVEDMLKRSFAEFHAQKKLPEKQQLLMRKLAQPTTKIECIKGEPAIEEYFEMLTEAESHREYVLEKVMQSSSTQQFLSPGRVVVVKSQSVEDHLLGVVLKIPSSSFKQHIVLVLRPDLPPTLRSPSVADKSQGKGSGNAQEGYFIAPKSKRGLDDDYFSSGSSRKGSGVINLKLPYGGSAAGMSFEVKGIEHKEFLSICKSKLKIEQVRLLEDCSNAAFSKTVQELLKVRSNGNKYPPALDPILDLKLNDMVLVEAYNKWTSILQRMSENKCHGCVKLKEHISLLEDINKHHEEVKALRFQMSDEALQQMPDFQGRIDVLKQIDCIDSDLIVQIKGRVACEMNSGEELISTECLFENQLEDLEPEEAVALMSALVFQQRNTSEPSLTPKLAQAKERLYDTAIRLGKLQEHFKVQINPEEYAADNLKFGLMEVVYEWAKGTPFADICELTDVPEGLIVRTIVRLDETCREFKNAAAIMGNSALHKKMETASNAIKRDIVFAASLYITVTLRKVSSSSPLAVSDSKDCKRRSHTFSEVRERPNPRISAHNTDVALPTSLVIHSQQFEYISATMDVERGMFNVNQTVGSVLCCKCGISMAPNAANMCVKCLRSEVDITEGLQKHVIIMWCPECQSYLQPPRTWIKAQLESKELLTFCVKRLENLNKVRLINAEFVWTEPHSKRIKVKLKVQKEVLNGVILEQAYVVEYVQTDHMCESCSRVQANPDQWVAAVQLRQHVSHRRSFFYLEQLILKHDAAIKAIKIKQMDEGIDFFFSSRSHALKFMEFVGKVVPIKSRSDKQLVSHDTKSNNYNYKYTFSVEICPICREDLVCLPPKVAVSLGNLGPLVICSKVSNNIVLVDPFTLRHAFIDADQYWRNPFRALLTGKQLVEYIVLDVDSVGSEVNVAGSKYALADVQVARVSDFGKNDKMFTMRTHLGHLLNPGDYALGYDLYGANNNDIELDKYKNLVLPDAILIKKSYEEKRLKKRGKPRAWTLKSMNMEVDNTSRKIDEDKMNAEYEAFLEDLEENPELRFNISLYRNKEYQPSEMASVTDEEDAPSVPLEELLADLDISDEEDDEEDSMRE